MSVYFARVGDYMKIGFSDDPIARATTITRMGTRPADVAVGDTVDLVGWVPGDVWREGYYHAQHIESRVVGEWFHLDRKCAEDLIWADPRGVDLERMSAMAVFACLRHPELTRDEIEAAGIPVMASGDLKGAVDRIGQRIEDARRHIAAS